MRLLGIDTSNYRTSLCIINEHYQVISEQNPLLDVKEGELGLQQSTAVFNHLKAWSTILQSISKEEINAIGVSTKPRPSADSYMPVFKVGEVLAETLAHFLSVPLYRTSHQEGHVAAGEYSIMDRPVHKQFLAVHLSGGTSEVLLCHRTEQGYHIEKLGGTLDLHAGQFVDRVGVKLGLPFPAGPYIEKLALSWEEEGTVLPLPTIPSYTKGIDFSFSGPTSAALRLIDANHYKPGQIARAVENTIAKTLEKSLLEAINATAIKEILLVGGVAANHYLTNRLKKRLEHKAVGGKLYMALPKYATDNAFGVACIALNRLKSEQFY